MWSNQWQVDVRNTVLQDVWWDLFDATGATIAHRLLRVLNFGMASVDVAGVRREG